MKIYQIDSSARKEGSTSRALAKKLLDKIKKPEDEVIYRDLDDEMVFVSGLTESGMKIDKKDQTDHHKKMFELSDKLVNKIPGSENWTTSPRDWEGYLDRKGKDILWELEETNIPELQKVIETKGIYNK